LTFKLSKLIFVSYKIITQHIFNPKNSAMLGAIAGDVIGSRFERDGFKSKEFPLFTKASIFTDDTAMTIAVADALLNNKAYEQALKSWGRRYPLAGYGGTFRQWLAGLVKGPYNSWGNGSAMRVSPVGWLCNTLEEVLTEAEASAAVTHNHPEGVKGAQAIAVCIFLARTGHEKEAIRDYCIETFGYNLRRKIDDIRIYYSFDVSCQGSVPEAIIAFLESDDFEDAIRNAISLGGDSDTIAAMAGSIAEAYYGNVPQEIVDGVAQRLPEDMKNILAQFQGMFTQRV